MENLKLRRLAVFIENKEREDVVIIFAEPCIKVKYICFKILTYRNHVYHITNFVATNSNVMFKESYLKKINISD